MTAFKHPKQQMFSLMLLIITMLNFYHSITRHTLSLKNAIFCLTLLMTNIKMQLKKNEFDFLL